MATDTNNTVSKLIELGTWDQSTTSFMDMWKSICGLAPEYSEGWGS